MAELTTEQRRRVIQAMQETQDGLARAMRYSPEFRDMDLINFYNRHIGKLTAMLELNEWHA